VRLLVDTLVVTFNVRIVVDAEETGIANEQGSDCENGFVTVPTPAFRDWPRVRLYGLQTGPAGENILAPGIHPVTFFSWHSGDYIDHSGSNGSCAPDASAEWYAGFLAQVRGDGTHIGALREEINETLSYSSPASFRRHMDVLVRRQAQAFLREKKSLVRSGRLSRQDASKIRFRCRLQISDDRPEPRRELPAIKATWCQASESGSSH
jgi:hypothetical protein